MKGAQPIDSQIIAELTRRIVDAVHPLRIILFGSAAHGEMGPDSDLDVLVVVRDGLHRRETWRRIYSNMRGLGVAKDIVVATASDVARHQDDDGMIYAAALREGRELYRAPA